MPLFPPPSSGGTPDSDATLTTSDITTNNFTTAKHGFTPKGTNVGNFLKDDGTWAAPSGSGDMVLADAQTVTGAKTFSDGSLIVGAHTASAGTAMKRTAGTVMTTPEAGATEFSTGGFFRTVDTTNGRTQDCNQNIFYLAANGAALGPTIADVFGANSSLPTVTNGIYELTFHIFYLKTTAGTVTWTITNTQAYTNIVALAFMANSAGIQAFGTAGGMGIVTTTAAAAALPATTSQTTAVNQHAFIRAYAECGTAGNIRLRVTSSAGTVTPLRGSYYTARRISGNVGTFVA